jgi:uncharacterized membrane protein
MVAGISQTALPEPLGEEWSCSAFFQAGSNTGKICVGFLWQKGVTKPLPTFSGGHNGFATGINNSGQVVGWAENGAEDNTCNNPQKLQFRAALWELNGRSISITELRPLGADETSAATAINERGEITGGAIDASGKRVAFIARPVIEEEE